MTEKNQNTLCFTLYGTLVLALFLQFSILASLISTVLVLAAIIVAYLQRPKTAETIYQSHYHWMIRTFWIGGAVYLPILTVAAAGVIYVIVLPVLQGAIDDGVTDPDALKYIIMQDKGTELILYGALMFLPFAAWWFYRCGKGIKLLLNKQPVVNVDSWV